MLLSTRQRTQLEKIITQVEKILMQADAAEKRASKSQRTVAPKKKRSQIIIEKWSSSPL